MSELLETITIEPQIPAEYSVIWLHGLGANGHDFEPIVTQFKLNQLPIRFIFPHAPMRPVTLNNGYVMRAWYDIQGLTLADREDEPGILQSEQLIQQLMQQEITRGIPAHHIVLAGFSQGGAMALFTGLRYPSKIAGILGLSCYLPLRQKILAEAETLNARDLPIMMTHGEYDVVVNINWAEQSRQFLQQLDYTVSWHTYPMEHQVCLEEMTDIVAWLKQIITK